MPELRYDPIRSRWVIIATERARRPHEYVQKHEEPKGDPSTCPFCYGNESKTPPEVFVIGPPDRKPNTPGWEVRVVPNKYPALRIEGELKREGLGLFDIVSGIGAHEVIIESPDHYKSLGDLPVEHIQKVLIAYRERIKDLRKDVRFRYILVFKNHRAEAGASLPHSHSQLIATPIIPPVVVQELNVAREHYSRKERCIFCDLIKQELLLKDRIVYEDEDYIEWAPFASAFPFETWILPKRHLHDFAILNDDELLKLARVLKDMLQRIKTVLDDPPYNMILHTAPSPHPRPGREYYWSTIHLDYHWHIELVPRLTRIAGFEWGSGLYINPTPPEEAAKFLREAEIEPPQ